jgi:hypothetical protein
MKHLHVQVSFSILILAGLLACSSSPQTAREERSAAIAVVMDGGGVPTADQIARVYARMGPEIARLGYAIASNPRVADAIVHVKFTPDLGGGDGDRVSILTVAPKEDERRKASASREEFKEISEKAIRSQMTEPR